MAQFTTKLPAPGTPSTTVASSTSIDLSWTDNSDNEDGYRVFYSTDGGTTWTQFSDLAAGTTTETVTGLTQDTSYTFEVRSYTEHVITDSSDVSATTYLNVNRGPSSYNNPLVSSAEALFDVSYDVSSHTKLSSSTAEALITVDYSVNSYSAINSSIADRGSVNYATRLPPNSYLVRSISFTTNERTSLELIDYNVEWSDSDKVWRTPWVKNNKILGSEDDLVLRTSVVEGAKDPAARIVIEYDADGNDIPDEKSDLIDVKFDGELDEVTGIPINEDGRYRIVISEYSGFNSLYSLDMAIVQ